MGPEVVARPGRRHPAPTFARPGRRHPAPTLTPRALAPRGSREEVSPPRRCSCIGYPSSETPRRHPAPTLTPRALATSRALATPTLTPRALDTDVDAARSRDVDAARRRVASMRRTPHALRTQSRSPHSPATRPRASPTSSCRSCPRGSREEVSPPRRCSCIGYPSSIASCAMKDTHTCPRCRTSTIVHVRGPTGRDGHPLALHAETRGSTVHTKASLEAYACSTCGYLEFYVRNPRSSHRFLVRPSYPASPSPRRFGECPAGRSRRDSQFARDLGAVAAQVTRRAALRQAATVHSRTPRAGIAMLATACGAPRVRLGDGPLPAASRASPRCRWPTLRGRRASRRAAMSRGGT
jgi:hypothetical protein